MEHDSFLRICRSIFANFLDIFLIWQKKQFIFYKERMHIEFLTKLQKFRECMRADAWTKYLLTVQATFYSMSLRKEN